MTEREEHEVMKGLPEDTFLRGEERRGKCKERRGEERRGEERRAGRVGERIAKKRGRECIPSILMKVERERGVREKEEMKRGIEEKEQHTTRISSSLSFASLKASGVSPPTPILERTLHVALTAACKEAPCINLQQRENSEGRREKKRRTG